MRAIASVLLVLATHCIVGIVAATLAIIPEVTPDANGVTSVTLTVDTARITVDDAVTFTTRAFYYGGSARLFGPMIVLQAGGRLNLTLVNKLSDDSVNDAGRAMNTFRHSNTTNIHTHGLHVTPSVDNVVLSAAPGVTLHYDLPIPANHAPGMHWYHSHSHGASTLQVMGGLVGPLYVQWLERDNIPASIRNLSVTRIVMQHLNFVNETAGGITTQSCSGGKPGFNPFKTFSFSELEDLSGSFSSAPVYASGIAGAYFLINGQFRPTITMAPGESRLFQLVYAAGSKSPALIFPNGCTAQNIAFDGVYFNGAPRTVTYLQLIVASRVEFVLTCATSGTQVVRSIVNGGPGVMTTGGDPLFSIQVTGTTQSSAVLPASLATITRPSYLADLQTASVDVNNTITVSQAGTAECHFQLGMGTDCSNGASTTCAMEYYSGAKGDTDSSAYQFRMRVGQTAEWTLYGVGNAAHPLHIHINHFQVMSYSGGTDVLTPWAQVGDWRDTMPVLAGSTKIRFTAADIAGETMLHCHELSHEDRGLMNSFLILPALNTSSTTAGASTSTTTAVTSTPSATAAATPPTTAGLFISNGASSGAESRTASAAILLALLTISTVPMMI